MLIICVADIKWKVMLYYFSFIDVPVPLHISSVCADYDAKGTINIISGSTCIAIVTKDGKFFSFIFINRKGIVWLNIVYCWIGRFDLRHPIFSCSSCGNNQETTPEKYIESGYFLGTISFTSCYFSIELIEFWIILKHETPGTSLRKFVKTLELTSKMRGRAS